MTASTRKGMPDLTPNAITVLERRYLVKDDHGAPVEGPEDLFWRGGRPRSAADVPVGAVGGAGGGLGGAFLWPVATRVLGPYAANPLSACRPLVPPSACF